MKSKGANNAKTQALDQISDGLSLSFSAYLSELSDDEAIAGCRALRSGNAQLRFQTETAAGKSMKVTRTLFGRDQPDTELFKIEGPMKRFLWAVPSERGRAN